jgi:thiol-disulfide isomerase/thioredoxin
MTVPAGSGRRGLLLAALALLLAACSSAVGTAPSSRAVASDAAGLSALDFRAVTLEGGEFDAAALAGTPVVLWFWAPWCTICRTEAPGVAKVAAEYEGTVAFLGIPGRGEIGEMREFVEDTGTGALTHVVDDDGALWQRFDVVAQPAFAFVGADGTVETFGGSLDPDSLRAAAAELMAG